MEFYNISDVQVFAKMHASIYSIPSLHTSIANQINNNNIGNACNNAYILGKKLYILGNES
jgi:hypothetical protein